MTRDDEHEASKGMNGKGDRSQSKGKSKGKGTPRSTTPPTQNGRPERFAKPSLKPDPEPQKKFPVFKTRT